MALTTAQIINIAKASQFLSQIDVAKGSLFGKRVTPKTPLILYMERKAVEWLYNLDPTNTSLVSTGNYLYSLCRGYNLKAMSITGNGGSVSPVTPDTAPNPYDFEVSGSSFIVSGATSKTITAFAGYNLLFVRGGIPQSTLDLGGSYYSWNRDTQLFTFSPAAVATESFQLYPI